MRWTDNQRFQDNWKWWASDASRQTKALSYIPLSQVFLLYYPFFRLGFYFIPICYDSPKSITDAVCIFPTGVQIVLLIAHPRLTFDIDCLSIYSTELAIGIKCFFTFLSIPFLRDMCEAPLVPLPAVSLILQ